MKFLSECQYVFSSRVKGWRVAVLWWRYCWAVVAVLVGSAAACSALDATSYPYSYAVEQQYIGVQVYPSSDTSGAYFAVKRQPFWAGDGSVVSLRKSSGQVYRSSTLAGVEMLCGVRLAENALLLVVAQNNILRCMVLDTALAVVATTALPPEYVAPRYANSAAFAPSPHRFLVAFNGMLFAGTYRGKSIAAVPIARAVAGVAAMAHVGFFAYAIHTAGGTEVVFCDSSAVVQTTVAMQTQAEMRLQALDADAVALIEKLDASSAVSIVERNGSLTKALVPAPYTMVGVRRGEQQNYVVSWMRDSRSGSEVRRGVIQRGGTDMRVSGVVSLPDYLFDPMCLCEVDGIEYGIFRSGMATLSREGELLSAGRLSLPTEENMPPSIVSTARGVVLVQPSGSIALVRQQHALWWLNRIVDNSLLYILALAGVLAIALLWKTVYRQRRLLRTLFEAPEAEPMLIMDPEGRLLQLNDSARVLFRIPPDVPMRRMLHSYLVGVTGLRELAQDVLVQRHRSSQRVEVVHSGGEGDEYAFTATPVFSMFRQMRWIFITGRNITRELERKRVANWAQLAHDMQTNLSIIRLNAEKIIATADDSPIERGKKILLQANLLINRVRDLVTIGRQDTLNIEQVDVLEMCTAVCQEFDPTFFPHVLFHIEAPMVFIACDRPKLERALRNAVENAIRALQGNDGTIELSSWVDDAAVYFQIKDSGVGMDKQTMESMMKPFFTTFGKQGGTGMGTVIMRHVIQMHGGELFVESEKGRGTSVVFRLPQRGGTVRQPVGDDAVAAEGETAV